MVPTLKIYLIALAAWITSALTLGDIVVEDALDEGQACWRIETPAATYFYHKEGAGFSSLLDIHGNDWIDYHPGGGPQGEHRGIPNMVFQSNGNYFHPGHTGEKGSTSLIDTQEDRVTISSVSRNRAWEVNWTIFETHATMTVKKAGGPYWFLYEGTPGGGYDTEKDWYLTSSGAYQNVDTDYEGDLPAPEWIAFGEEVLDIAFFVAHHQDDDIEDIYLHWHAMTVFGFGRARPESDNYIPLLQGAGQSFSIGFLPFSSRQKLGLDIEQFLSSTNEPSGRASQP